MPRRLIFDSTLDDLAPLAEAIDGFCAESGRADEAPAFNLCAEELFTNVVLHGFGGETGHAIAVTLAQAGDAVTIEIADDAPPFDPTVPVRPDLDASVEDRAIGGLGRYLVSTMMDRFCYRRENGCNHVAFGRDRVRNAGA